MPMLRSKEGSNRRLEKVIQHVCDHWIPINPNVLKKVQLGFEKNAYANTEAVFEDIREDLSLTLFVLMQLSKIVSEGGKQVPLNPHELFSLAEMHNIRQVLSIDPRKVSNHSLTNSSATQISRFKEMLISASTSEILAPHHGVNPEEGFTAALLRQLGVSLISFNYPSIYDECLNELKPGQSLDVLITERLGFSPTVLAHTLFERWGIAPGYREALDSGRESNSASATLNGIGASLSKICAVGEALARANDPEHYPTAAQDWDFAKQHIERELGKRGLSVIRKKLRQNCKSLFSAAPNLFKGGIILDPEMAIAHHWDDDHLRQNPFLASCRDPFKRAMHDLYAHLTGVERSRECLGKLVKDCLPLCGFDALIIYTVDPATRLLIPQLKVGKPELRSMNPVSLTDRDDCVCLAHEASVPLIEHIKRGERHKTYLAWLLGVSNRAGVLYAEMNYQQFSDPEIDYLAHFKALSKAFSDCLNLG